MKKENEIDNIFNTTKKTKAKKREIDNDFDIRGNKKESRRYTSDGFPVYTLDELQTKSNPEPTDECPFDCQCCT